MEAATPLPFAQVRVVGDALRVDGLVVDDECAVRQAAEADDPARFVSDAIAIGARVLDREQAGANAEFVRAEFERAASELNVQFVERARAVAEGMSTVITRHFGDESSEAVQHKVRQVVHEVSLEMQRQLRAELLSEGEQNPLAQFHLRQVALQQQAAKAQSEQMAALHEKLEATRLEIERLRAERQRLEAVEAERERGTAKGRTFEEEVAEAIDAIALAQGDVAEAVGDRLEAGRKVGDVVVAIDAANGPARGRIVFEAKNTQLSRPRMHHELDDALAERNADFAVLVVASDEKLPARTHQLREYHGDKMVVVYDPEQGPLALQVAYSLARARVRLRKADAGDVVDLEAIRAGAERAIQSLAEVQKIKQQLTHSRSAADKAEELVDAMAATVRANLAEIEQLVAAAAAGGPAEPA
ncbi:MAG TPA: hypothetical protein VHB30_00930 [Solirubrobacteraceae bacterium]|jgi:hypothetical protein|nr:hypothetical protein [Solirubrobacteraceae bacterium]